MFEQRNKACGQYICLSTDSIVPITPKKVKLLKNHDNTARKAWPFIAWIYPDMRMVLKLSTYKQT